MSMARNRREDEIQRMLSAADQRSGEIRSPYSIEEMRGAPEVGYVGTPQVTANPADAVSEHKSKMLDKLSSKPMFRRVPTGEKSWIDISVGDAVPIPDGGLGRPLQDGERVSNGTLFTPPPNPMERVYVDRYEDQLTQAGQAYLSALGGQQVQSPYSVSSPMPIVGEEIQRLIMKNGGSIGKSGVRLNAPIREQADPIDRIMAQGALAEYQQGLRLASDPISQIVAETRGIPVQSPDELAAQFQNRLQSQRAAGGIPAPQVAPVQATPAIGPPSIQMPMPQRNSGLSAGVQQQPEPQAQGNRIRPPGFNTMSPKNQQIVMQYEQIYPQMSTQEIIDRLTRSSAR